MCIHTSKSSGKICMDFTCLVDSNEPVSISRGSWGMKDAESSKFHAAPWHYEDAKRHKGEDNLEVDHNFGSCYDESTSEYQLTQKEKEPQQTENDASSLSRSWQSDDEVLSPVSFNIGGESQVPHELPAVDNDIEQLKKHIKSLNKKIKHFEDNYEAEFGFRPSHSEMRKDKKIKKYMSEMSKARKELKQMKYSMTSFDSNYSDQELSTSESQEMVSCQKINDAIKTLELIEENLKEKRSACGRRDNMAAMTLDELMDEKTAIQKALLYYESTHGRPKTKEDRDLAKPLYDRYRQCKRLVLRAESQEKENMGDLPPIIEHETMCFTQISPIPHGCLFNPGSDEEISPNSPDLIDKEAACSSQPLGNLHTLSLHDLKTRKKDVREEKKRLKKEISEFEKEFEMENERKFRKEDRTPMEQTYLDYKYAKAKSRLIEALITKLQPIRIRY